MKYQSIHDVQPQLILCRDCPRLVAWREEVGRVKRRAFRDQTYWARPVPGFGDPQARVLVLGLAPGAHGSNRTGRMFTGDDSGKFLYAALWRAGFANQSEGTHLNDGLQLKHLWITAVCRCAPPDNKPTRAEIETCRPWLKAEIALLPNLSGVVALGRIAWDEAVSLLGIAKNPALPDFAHGSLFRPGEEKPWLLGSYHPSRQNTQTGRLTADMFNFVWNTVKDLLAG